MWKIDFIILQRHRFWLKTCWWFWSKEYRFISYNNCWRDILISHIIISFDKRYVIRFSENTKIQFYLFYYIKTYNLHRISFLLRHLVLIWLSNSLELNFIYINITQLYGLSSYTSVFSSKCWKIYDLYQIYRLNHKK